MRASFKKNRYIILFSVTTALLLCFIWGNSMQNGEESNLQSKAVLEWMMTFLPAEALQKWEILHFLLRKAAHFSEYCMLALSLSGLFYHIYLVYRKKNVLTGFFLVLLAAVLDEWIQRYTGRTSSVIDVLIDFSGGCFGFLLVYAGWTLRKRLRK